MVKVIRNAKAQRILAQFLDLTNRDPTFINIAGQGIRQNVPSMSPNRQAAFLFHLLLLPRYGW